MYTYVNGCIGNEHQVVPIREVEEVETDGGEAKNEWSNRSVADGDDKQVGVYWESIAYR
jgi:hypothetical protein